MIYLYTYVCTWNLFEAYFKPITTLVSRTSDTSISSVYFILSYPTYLGTNIKIIYVEVYKDVCMFGDVFRYLFVARLVPRAEASLCISYR